MQSRVWQPQVILMSPAIYFWHGPARVVATQLPSTVWLSYNHHLVKASPEKLRPASEAEEEFYSISGWLEGIFNAKKQFETNKIKGMIDLSQENDEQPPTERQDFWRREGKSEFMNFRDGNYFVLIMIFPSCLSTWTNCCHGESRS